MKGTFTVNDKTVGLQVTITPVLEIDNSNLRFFAAIVEKKTINNVATNGEHEFMYVMKKFMTNISGDIIDTLRLNDSVTTKDYSYTFNGNYRLPEDSRTPINHSIEHSVEDFNNLMVVYWLQNIVTKEVYQAGKIDPNPGYTPVSYNVTVYVNDVKMGTVSGGHAYAPNTMGRVSAVRNKGYQFVEWSDGVKDATRSFTITQDTSFTAIFEVAIGITDIDVSASIVIFPNPVRDILHINTDANIEQIEIYNIQGQLIKTENTNTAEISTMDLSSGLYLLRITSDMGISTHKFIKE
jgi:hypothetical protein